MTVNDGVNTETRVSGLSVNENGSQSIDDHEPVSEAGEGVRTLDIDVGNVTLYQLSYARTSFKVYLALRAGQPLIGIGGNST